VQEELKENAHELSEVEAANADKTRVLAAVKNELQELKSELLQREIALQVF